MEPCISVIVPVYREGTLINECLDRISRWRTVCPLEVILVDGDGGSTAEAITPANRDYDLVTIVAPAGRGIQLDRGARAARSGILLFLHVDTRLPNAAPDLVRSALRGSDAGAFGFYVRTRNPFVQTVALFASVRARLTRVPYGDQAHFLRRAAYEAVGGYPHLPVMEDVALMTALRRAGTHIRILRARAVNTDRRWRKEGSVRSTLRNWNLMIRYRAGAKPCELAERYRPHSEA